MAPSTFVDMVRVAAASAGVGPLVLGPPVTAFQGTEALIDGNQYSYSIQQEPDDAWEYGQGIWNASTSTLVRGVIKSSLGTSPVGLRAGTPISITILAEDFAATDQAALAAAVASAQQSAADAYDDTVLTAADRVATGQDRTAAGNSATAAAGSAGAAATSATAANNSAVAADADAAIAAGAVSTVTAAAAAAAGSATTASNAASAAGTAATTATDEATAAGTSATNAAASATTSGNNAASTAADRVQTGLDRTAAANSVTAAGISELNAGNSATAAAGSATTAQNSATDAANSATAAGVSATNAFNSATAAGAHVADAAASATAAAASATTAGNNATNAANSATTAGTSATNAAGSATTAGTAATNAGNSATAAGTSATNAAGSAATAATAATSAATSATTATGQVALAAAQAAIATTAASSPSFKIQTNPATPTVPPSGVASGDTYWVVDANPATKLTLYLNTGGTGAPTATSVIDPLALGGHLIGQGIPANNLGTDGFIYTDSLTGLNYGPKTGGVWPLGTVVDANIGWSHYDLSIGAAFPSSLLPWTRVLPATAIMTNLTYWDSPGAGYQTFASGTPIQRTLEGVILNATSRNVFLNSTAPVTQNCTVVVGSIIVWSNNDAGLTITTAAGTAVGTGFGAVVAGTPQVLTITTAGTISVTSSGTGTWYACQVEYNPVLPSNSVATPLIITAGSAVTRDADSNLAAGALLSQFQSSTGTFMMEVSRVETQSGYGRTPGLLSLATGATYAYINSGTQVASRGGLATATLGSQTWATSQKFAIAWSGSSISFDAGDKIATADPNTWPAVTAARIACRDNTTAGQQALCGWIKRIKWRPDRLSDDALFALVSPNRYTGVTANV